MADTRILSRADKFAGATIADIAAKFPSSLGDLTPPAPGVALGATVQAEVNSGRWIVRCPTCAGAEYVDLDEPLFFCCECRNAATGHQPIPVIVPSASERTRIEAYLVVRPVPASRGWLPGQTVKELQAENRAHGIRLTRGD